MEKSKKIKNSKKSCLIVLLVLFLAAGVGACYWFCFWQQAQAADGTPEPVLEEGQEYTYAKITSILGNEMSYVIVEAKTVDFDAPQGQGSRRKERGGSVEEAGRSGVQKSSARIAVENAGYRHHDIYRDRPDGADADSRGHGSGDQAWRHHDILAPVKRGHCQNASANRRCGK